MVAVFKKVFLFTILVSSMEVFAEDKTKKDAEEKTDGANQVEVNEVKKEFNITPGEDIDDLIQNKQLRATAGSKSRLSVSTSLNYDGGPITAPLSSDRPNISGETGNANKTILSGDVSLQYNITPVHSLSAGVGMRYIAPFGTVEPGDYEGTRFDVQNPFLSYQYVYDYEGLESVFNVQWVRFTEGHLKERGYANSLVLSQDSFYKIGSSRWSVGFSSWAQVSNYTKEGPLGTPSDDFYMEDVRADQSDYGIGFEPLVEYEINDRFTIRAVTILAGFEHARIQPNPTTFRVNNVVQSIGVGISVIRDIYLFPSIQVPINRIRPEFANVSLNAEINAF